MLRDMSKQSARSEKGDKTKSVDVKQAVIKTLIKTGGVQKVGRFTDTESERTFTQ